MAEGPGSAPPRANQRPTAQREALLRAKEAAEARNPVAYLQALYDSGVLDGLKRQLARVWDSISADEIDLVLARTADEIYERIAAGTSVSNLGGYLYKAAVNRMDDFATERARMAPDADEDVAELVEEGRAAPYASPHSAGLDDDGLHPDQARKTAIAIARSVVPELGQVNVQRVMTLILDALERGAVELPNEEIAAALGVDNSTVRVWRSRAFERLRTRMEQKGWRERLSELHELILVDTQLSEADRDEISNEAEDH